MNTYASNRCIEIRNRPWFNAAGKMTGTIRPVARFVICDVVTTA
jgi:hypothetical protein